MRPCIESCGIEIGGITLCGQRISHDRFRGRIDRTMAFSPLSVTQAAPSGPTITPCGADFSQRNTLDSPRLGIKTTQDAGSLTGVPDRAIRRGRYIMRVLSWLQGKIFRLGRPCREALHDQWHNENNNRKRFGLH